MEKQGKKKLRRGAFFLVQAAIIGAVYAVLTVALEPISYGPIQLRISEALCVLPFFTPAAIPGLAVGCLIANIFGGMGLLDVIVGPLATLAAAVASYYIRPKWIVPLPAVVINAFALGFVLDLYTGAGYWTVTAYLAAEQAVCCFGFGLPLLLVLEKYRDRIFRLPS